MSPWDKAFTREMRKIFAAFPDDLEVRAVLAESIMNETPWQMWDLPSGKPAEERAPRNAGRCWNSHSTGFPLRGITRDCCISMST
jgi:hypothetical protein